MTTNITVIGTGNMGSPMAINLSKAGLKVNAYDIVEEKLTPLKQHDIRTATNHQDAIQDADIILTMLPTGTEVKDVYFNQILGCASKNCILIDSSTIDLKDAQEVHGQAQNAGYQMLDAPVSGGTVGAHNAALTFMVGGDHATLETATPALSTMGKKIIHCGAAGMGQAAKMCNNMMLGIQMASVVEGFHLAKQVGLTDKKLFEVASNSSGNCFALTTFCPIPDIVATAPSTNNYQPGFSIDLMLKDMKLALNAAEQSNLNLDLAPIAKSLYEQFSEGGNSGLDFSAIYKI